MITGARLFAPEGYRSLVKGHYYHFLNSDAVHNRVRLVEFSDLAKDVRTTLITPHKVRVRRSARSGCAAGVRGDGQISAMAGTD